MVGRSGGESCAAASTQVGASLVCKAQARCASQGPATSRNRACACFSSPHAAAASAAANPARGAGLLVRFVIKTVRTYQPQPEMAVEAPEFMTVEYLKRRIMKAKLLRGEVGGSRAKRGPG